MKTTLLIVKFRAVEIRWARWLQNSGTSPWKQIRGVVVVRKFSWSWTKVRQRERLTKLWKHSSPP